MTQVIRTLVSPEGTIRIDVIEGDTSADVVSKLESALTAFPLTAKLGRTSIKDMMYGRKTAVSGWHVEVNGVSLAPSAQAAIAPAQPADGAQATAPAAAAAPSAAPAVAAPATPAPVASPAAGSVKHSTARKARVARTKGAAPAAPKGRQEKIYKLGPNPAVGTGMMARIAEAVGKGYNTQAKLLNFFPDAKKATVQHEICCAGHSDRKWIAVDEDAMKKAAVSAAPAPVAAPAPATPAPAPVAAAEPAAAPAAEEASA